MATFSVNRYMEMVTVSLPDFADGGPSRVGSVIEGKSPSQQLVRHHSSRPDVRGRHHCRAEYLGGHEPAAAIQNTLQGTPSTPYVTHWTLRHCYT